MSRIGKLPIAIPGGVEVKVLDAAIEVKGPKGTITTPRHEAVEYKVEGGQVVITRKDDSKVSRSQHGLRRALLANCVDGVSKGWSKVLEFNGVGYRVAVKGEAVEMSLGFSHPVIFQLPQGITANVEGNKLTISGIDKAKVGEVAASIRRLRKPEPYKGKGIKYENEQIRRKAGKSGKK
ncbi:MAG: 50S ribosomal protein L6 [Desulfovibrionaceae bacterium]|nr:50S ribosomal protein L6 [Desulfovibrionaceae bacterium]